MPREYSHALTEGLTGGLVITALTVFELLGRKFTERESSTVWWLTLMIAFVLGFVCIGAVAALLKRRELNELHHTYAKLMTCVLRGLKYEYQSCPARRGAAAEIRVNVMIPTKGDPRSRRRNLKIVYMDLPDLYAKCEKNLEWHPDQGNVGRLLPTVIRCGGRKTLALSGKTWSYKRCRKSVTKK
jgi:hypothetical protein